MKRLLFYNDASDYGGHEVMTCEAAKHLIQDAKDVAVAFAFFESNIRLSKRLVEFQRRHENLELYPLKIRSRSLQPFRTLSCPWKVNAVRTLMSRIRPEVVIVSQGRIESGSLGLLAAKRAGLRTISYIPMAHHIAVCGKPYATGIRESVNRYFYGLPDKFITISEACKRMLLERGATSDVVVVPNGVEAKPIQQEDIRGKFRRGRGIQADEYVIAIIGRIDFRQKAQDFAIQAISSFRQKLGKCKFVFVGNGQDEGRLRAFIAHTNLDGFVEMLSWSDNPAEIYAGIDMLLIPSRFEGMPLVMLEAMSYGLPVVASNIDGMAELLPSAWLFPSGDAQAMIDALLRVQKNDYTSIVKSNKIKVLEEFSMKQFCINFSKAVLNEN